MKIREMEILHAILRTGSVTGAARVLNISQPSVTKILRHCEDRVKFRFFDRVKGRLVPTNEALILYPKLQRLFDEMQSITQTADDLLHSRTGRLSIATIPTLGEVAIPRAIATFKASKPDVKFELQIRPRRQIVDLVASQTIDLGFAFLVADHASIHLTELCRGQIVCVMPPDHPLAKRKEVRPRHLVDQDVITYSRDQGLRTLIDSTMTEARVEIRSHVEVGWLSSAWSLVAQGVGVALVDDFSNLHRLYPHVQVRRFRPKIELTAEIMFPSLKPLSRLAQDFIVTARKELVT